jgi:hypothetical protein
LGESFGKMGGCGSGYNGSKKQTVEEGLTLSISAMMREGALNPGRATSGEWLWLYPGHEPHARIGYRADMTDSDQATIRLIYRANGNPMDYVVRLVWTTLHNGGRRWWFLCPIRRDVGKDARRVGKLHLPSGAHYFGSREAYGLTYRSSQESGKFNALFAQVAGNIGTDVATIRKVIRSAQR